MGGIFFAGLAAAAATPSAPASAPRLAALTCPGGERAMVRFADGAAELTYPNGAIVHLQQQPAGSGISYQGIDQALRGKGEDITWTVEGRSRDCRAVSDLDRLTGSRWMLEEIRARGQAVRPADATHYELALEAEGRLAMRLDCNRAAGRWLALPVNPGRGELTLTPMAMTRAACPAGSLDQRIAADAERVRGYAVSGDRLELRLEGGGSYVWKPAGS